MKKVREPKATRIRDAGRIDTSTITTTRAPANERVRVVRVSAGAGRPVRWHVSRPDAKP